MWKVKVTVIESKMRIGKLIRSAESESISSFTSPLFYHARYSIQWRVNLISFHLQHHVRNMWHYMMWKGPKWERRIILLERTIPTFKVCFRQNTFQKSFFMNIFSHVLIFHNFYVIMSSLCHAMFMLGVIQKYSIVVHMSNTRYHWTLCSKVLNFIPTWLKMVRKF